MPRDWEQLMVLCLQNESRAAQTERVVASSSAVLPKCYTLKRLGAAQA